MMLMRRRLTLNSVDTSTALEINLGWYRLVCCNGMMFGLSDSHLRRLHVPSLDPDEIAHRLDKQFEQVPNEHGLSKKWLKHHVDTEALSDWVDDRVADGTRPMLNSSLDHLHKELRTTLKMPPGSVLHSLRHTYGTQLGEGGADAFSIMCLMGHSSVTISQRYVHPTPEALEMAVQRLEALNQKAIQSLPKMATDPKTDTSGVAVPVSC
jgi:integrase